jgi:biopolymer transport protein ExbB
MFLSADIMVKAVMIGLAFASLVTWTIFLAKSPQLFRAWRGLRKALTRVANTKTLMEAQVAAAIQEIRLSAEGATGGIQARAASRFAEIDRSEGRSARSGMGIVAMIAPTAPFVGLFGTCGAS